MQAAESDVRCSALSRASAACTSARYAALRSAGRNAERNPFLAPDKWKAYGTVHRLTMPGHLGARTSWTDGPTRIDLTLRGAEMSIAQDGTPLASTKVAGALGDKLRRRVNLKPTPLNQF